MKKSITQFFEVGIKKIEKSEDKFIKNPSDIASFALSVKNEILELGLSIIAEMLEEIDLAIKDNLVRKKYWDVVKTDNKTLVTCIGAVKFNKTLYKNKRTGERKYLLDKVLELRPHQRITEDAIAQLLEETVQTSYRKGGESVSLLDNVSKQAVKSLLHNLNFPREETPAEKRQVKYLYIDADEDHVALQYLVKKGDTKTLARKSNGTIAKLVYIYEGVEPVAPQSKRHRLINPHYFSGCYEGKSNGQLWDEVYEYIDNNYDIDSIERIFLNGDGGGWIKAGKSRIKGITYVLDEFHMSKYLTKMTGHLYDSADDAKTEIYDIIKNGSKQDFIKEIEKLCSYARDDSEAAKISEAGNYFLNNWSAARVRITQRNKIFGCSAEGHVSHVLSFRMSSRPMGWSKRGCDQMAKLRAYYWNKRGMLELARYQKEALPKAAGAEEKEFSVGDVMANVKRDYTREGAYYDSLQVHLSTQMDKHVKYGIYDYIYRLK